MLTKERKNINKVFFDKNYPAVASLLLDLRQKELLVLLLMINALVVLALVYYSSQQARSGFLLLLTFLMLVIMNIKHVSMVRTLVGAFRDKQSVEVVTLELPVVVLLVMGSVELVVSSEFTIGKHLINTSK